MRCPVCFNTATICPECSQAYPHGERTHCPNEECAAVNAPVDCAGCGRVVYYEVEGVPAGVMNLDGTTRPYRRR